MKTEELIALLARHPEAMARPRPLLEWTLALSVAVASAFALMLLLLGPRADLQSVMAQPMFWQKLGILGLFAASGLLWAHRAGIPGREGGWQAGLRWAGPLWAVAATLVTVLSAPAGARAELFWSPSVFWCLGMIPVLSVVPAIALIVLLQRAAPAEPARAARAAGMAAAGVGAVAYAFHCPTDQPGYLLLVYGAAIASTTLITQFVGQRLLRW